MQSFNHATIHATIITHVGCNPIPNPNLNHPALSSRDAQYITSLPLMALDRPGQLLLVAGVNHQQTGKAVYVNVGLTDPLQRTGVGAFDDVELLHSAGSLLAGSQDQPLSRYLYAVAFSRNCTGTNPSVSTSVHQQLCIPHAGLGWAGLKDCNTVILK